MKPSTQYLLLGGIVLLGLLLRAFYLAEISRDPVFGYRAGDASFHDYWARALVTGDWAPPHPYGDPQIRTTPYLRPPGYPYFLAMIYRLAGISDLAPPITQMALGMVNCVLAFFLGRRWFGPAVGLVLAALMSAYWVFIYFEARLHAPILLITLALSLMYTLSLWTVKITAARSVGAGVLLGLFAVVRPTILPFAAAVIAWGIWLARRRRQEARAGVAIAGFAVGIALAVLPVTIRNYVVARDWVLISANAGVNLYVGNNRQASGRFVGNLEGLGDFGSCYEYPAIVAAIERELGKPMKYSEVSAYFARKAIAYMRARPARALTLVAKKAALFWGPREITHNEVLHYERVHSRVLCRIPGSFAFVLSSAILGVSLLLVDFRNQRRQGRTSLASPRQFEVAVLVVAFVFLYSAAFLPFFVTDIYRLPVIPFLLVFSAYALTRLGVFVHSRRFLKAAAWAGAGVALYFLAAINFTGYEPDPAAWHFHLGIVYGWDGQIDRSIQEYRRALHLDPHFSTAHFNLGVMLTKRGQTDEAIHHYGEALRARPDYSEAHVNLADALHGQGKTDAAIAHFQEALRLDPALAEARMGLAAALLKKGQTDQAIGHYRQLLQLSPDSAVVHRRLALALASQGQLDQAVGHYRQAISANPGDAETHNNLADVLARQGRYPDAVSHYREALRIAPDHPAVLNNLAWLLATCPSEDVRNAPEALRLAHRAADLMPSNTWQALDTLAAAYAAAGQFDSAVATAERALQLATSSEATEMAENLRVRLQLYHTRRPYRQPAGPPQFPLD